MNKKNFFDINGKVIFITGAMGQIGQTIAKGLLMQGALVVLADRNLNQKKSLEKTLSEEGISSSNYLFLLLDITDDESCSKNVSEAIKTFGKIDVLINNAAIDAKFDNTNNINHFTRFENYPIKKLKESVEVNLIGTILISQSVCREMLKSGSGNIINVASTYSLVAPNQSLYDFGSGISSFKPVDYVASKSFIPNFTRYLATFYAKNNIRCNAIVPHGIYNNHSEQFLKNWERLSPLGRMCDREELIGPFTFLASDASSYMTGATLSIDGGWTAW